MARELPLSKSLEVVRLYFEGLPYDDIVEKTGVAKGSVAAIVEVLRAGEFPQFEHVTDMMNGLRDLTVGLHKAGVGITEATPLLILVKKHTKFTWFTCKIRLLALWEDIVYL